MLFTSKAISASLETASFVKMTSTFSVASNALYCFNKAFLGSVRIRSKSSLDKSFNSTRIGKRPCNSGIKSLGFATWKAPDAINKIWSVLITPYFVFTWLPSTIGKMSRCTPSRETSPPLWPLAAILSISSIKIIPEVSASFNASACISS